MKRREEETPKDRDDRRAGESVRSFFARDPIGADRAVFGRISHADLRGFLRGAGLGTMSAMVGANIPFLRNMPAGLVPAAVAAETVLTGKDGLTLLDDRPVSAETPPELLDDPVIPAARNFIRNNGLPSETVDTSAWTLPVDA